MKRLPTKRKSSGQQIKEYNWIRYCGRARMHVWNSGGPINAPHERVLQLLICPFEDTNESWTVYRHESDPAKDGKIVFKRWDCEADKPRFRKLIRKAADVWKTEPSVLERQFPVAGRWVKDLERVVTGFSVPPSCGPVRRRKGEERHRLLFWRDDHKSEFAWASKAPAAWRRLEQLFGSLLRRFRQHADGKPLPSVLAL
jgi:hypothetical protein